MGIHIRAYCIKHTHTHTLEARIKIQKVGLAIVAALSLIKAYF